jgi:hypothetical protein
VRLRATLFGVPVGELTVANEHGRGRVLDLSIGSSWLARAVAAALIQEAAALASQAAWEALCWELPGRDDSLRALARSARLPAGERRLRGAALRAADRDLRRGEDR